MQPAFNATSSDATDITAELAHLRDALSNLLSAPAPGRSNERLAKSAIAGVALIPTVFGAVAAGATALPEPPELPEPPPSERRPVTRDAHVVAPIQRFHVLPVTPAHRASPGATFSFHPRFKAMVTSQRGLRVTAGRGSRATLYQVAPGDSLYTISRALLGHGNRWREIYAANRDKLQSPAMIYAGMALALPAAAEGGHTYRVAPGDSLSAIAARRLNDAERWREIASLNRVQLRGGTTIHPRQVLLLPVV